MNGNEIGDWWIVVLLNVPTALRVALRESNAVETVCEFRICTNLLCPVVNGIVHGLEETIDGI
jgi:hypothetical protein